MVLMIVKLHPGRPIAIALDTKGPEIRTGIMRDDVELPISAGHEMTFSTNDDYAECCDLKVIGQDVRDIREILGENGKYIKIISKIENQQGVNNFDDILKESDGIMVARGDLGIEIPASHVFVAQKKIIAKCNIAGKPVVCATQMLESMTFNPRPTRAEGSYPIEAVKMMHENMWSSSQMASAAVSAALEQHAGCILVLSTSGVVIHFIYDKPRNEDWQIDVENRISWGWKGGLGNTNTIRILAAP
ncbi:unnamed protein product [Rhizophagus irregularis]|nr:unnamed protein product [Rhizophagus irregularis]